MCVCGWRSYGLKDWYRCWHQRCNVIWPLHHLASFLKQRPWTDLSPLNILHRGFVWFFFCIDSCAVANPVCAHRQKLPKMILFSPLGHGLENQSPPNSPAPPSHCTLLTAAFNSDGKHTVLPVDDLVKQTEERRRRSSGGPKWAECGFRQPHACICVHAAVQNLRITFARCFRYIYAAAAACLSPSSDGRPSLSPLSLWHNKTVKPWSSAGDASGVHR